MPYTWGGVEIPDDDWDQGRNAGLAGALAAMAPVSGANWNGVADWASRAAAGFTQGQSSYLSDAYQRMRQEEQDAIAEQYRQSQIAENEAQARRYQAQAAAQEQEALRTRDWMQSQGIDPSTPKDFIDDEYRSIQSHEEAARVRGELEVFAQKRGIDPTGVPLDVLKEMVKQSIAPEKPNYEGLRFEHMLREDEEADARQAELDEYNRSKFLYEQEVEAGRAAQTAYDKAPPPPQTTFPGTESLTGEDISGRTYMTAAPPPRPQVDQMALLQKHGLTGSLADSPALAPPAPPAPKPAPAVVKAERAATLEADGVMPQNSVAAPATASGGVPKPMPEKKAQNPAVATDEELAKMVAQLPIPPAMKGDPAFLAKMRSEIARKVQESGDTSPKGRARAAAAALDEFVMFARARGLVR